MDAAAPPSLAPRFQDGRSRVALQVLKALQEGSTDPQSTNFDVEWSLETAAPVDLAAEARGLIAKAFPEDVYGPLHDGMAGSFLASLGEQVQRANGWVCLSVHYMEVFGYAGLPHAIFSGFVAVARMSTVALVPDPVAIRLPGPARRLVRSFLYCREPLGRALQSWPLPWLIGRHRQAGLRLLQAPDSDLNLFGGGRLRDCLKANDLQPQRLEGRTWSDFLGGDIPHERRSDDWPQTELTASVALSALRVQHRLAAQLPVVLLGRSGEGAGDVQLCALANWLLLKADRAPPAAAPGLLLHHAGDAGAPLQALFEQQRPGEGPIALVRILAETLEECRDQVERFVELAAPSWEALPPQSPRVVLSLAPPAGASLRGFLGSLPPLLCEAAQFLD